MRWSAAFVAIVYAHASPPRPTARMAATLPLAGERTAASPQVAASEDQARALIDAWNEDKAVCSFLNSGGQFFTKAVASADGDATLHSTLVWAEGGGWPSGGARPGVVMVHTAVGPHDLFLRWRAHSLAALGYAVLIADLLGDERGDGWDPDWASPRRDELHRSGGQGLLRRTELAQATLVAEGGALVDGSRVGAIGFCFGGRAVLDLMRVSPDGLRAVVAFHAILDPRPPPASTPRARVLVCTARRDPFVPKEAVDALVEQLDAAGATYELQLYGGGARHGFSNPAQALNPRPAFGYDARACRASWDAATRVLGEELLLQPE